MSVVTRPDFAPATQPDRRTRRLPPREVRRAPPPQRKKWLLLIGSLAAIVVLVGAGIAWRRG